MIDSLALKFQNQKLLVLDQRLLPDKEEWLICESAKHMATLIHQLSVRGAPLIGVAAAAALAQESLRKDASLEKIKDAASLLRASRPTAVNLMWAIDRMLKCATHKGIDFLRQEAEQIFKEDVEMCQKLGQQGASLMSKQEHVMTYCNAGALATAGIGTAVGVIVTAFQQGKIEHVYVHETRPLLQGARLTAWEMQKAKIPYTLLCDNMSASLMRKQKMTHVFVGADRIAANGDFANKIGTYNLAIVAKHHNVPFYAVAPTSTLDLHCPTGAQIPIEERNSQEVRGASGNFGNIQWAPEKANTYNPSFDVTPFSLVSGVILENGLYQPIK